MDFNTDDGSASYESLTLSIGGNEAIPLAIPSSKTIGESINALESGMTLRPVGSNAIKFSMKMLADGTTETNGVIDVEGTLTGKSDTRTTWKSAIGDYDTIVKLTVSDFTIPPLTLNADGSLTISNDADASPIGNFGALGSRTGQLSADVDLGTPGAGEQPEITLILSGSGTDTISLAVKLDLTAMLAALPSDHPIADIIPIDVLKGLFPPMTVNIGTFTK